MSACGGGTDASSQTVPANADVVVRAVDGIAWNAKEYMTSTADGSVTIYAVNDSGILHNMYVLDGETPVGDFITLPKRGSDGTLSFDLAAGEYQIVCLVPGHNNMKSTLIVK